VLIDLPKDVQNGDAAHLPAHVPLPVSPNAKAPEHALHEAAALIAQSHKPVVYAGGGIVLGDALAAFRDFVEQARIPVVLTLKALGALPAAHRSNMGMLGMHGTRAANLAVQESDLMIVVGARFDDRATGKLSEFAPHARVVHLDADACEIGKMRRADCAVLGDLRTSLATLAPSCATQRDGRHAPSRQAWRDLCFERKRNFAARYDAPGDSVYAPALLKRLSELAPDAVVSCDVGQHQMWVAQHWRFNAPRNHLTSGGLGAMGFGLPAAIGAQVYDPAAQVICVSGDGSFLMNVQELATLKRYQLPVKIVLLDNQALGMVRQWQELFFDRRYSEVDLSDNPDFVAVANAFELQAFHVDHAADVEDALARLLDAPGPALLHVAIDQGANVWPLVPPNRNNAQMLDADIGSFRPRDAATAAATPAHAEARPSSNPIEDATHALPA
jgi:acetolactate synthase-1/2/3 large subunit